MGYGRQTLQRHIARKKDSLRSSAKTSATLCPNVWHTTQTPIIKIGASFTTLAHGQVLNGRLPGVIIKTTMQPLPQSRELKVGRASRRLCPWQPRRPPLPPFPLPPLPPLPPRPPRPPPRPCSTRIWVLLFVQALQPRLYGRRTLQRHFARKKDSLRSSAKTSATLCPNVWHTTQTPIIKNGATFFTLAHLHVLTGQVVMRATIKTTMQ